MQSRAPSAGAATAALISDPTRARLLTLLLESPDGRATVTALAEALALTQPTVSHHAKALHDEGILVREPEGRRAWYSIAPSQVDRVSELLQAPEGGGEGLDEAVIQRISRDLAERFSGVFGRETVERYVRESAGLLASESRMTRRLASSAAAFARDRLEALARTPVRSGGTPEILFVCVQNAGRSQMAAAILRQLAGDRVHVRTAGSAPAGAVRSVVVTALDEIGVPIGGEFPKPLTDEVVRAADVVVTMGCGDACPVYPGRRYLDWDLEDPVGLPLTRVRDIRDDIEGRVRELLSELA